MVNEVEGLKMGWWKVRTERVVGVGVDWALPGWRVRVSE